MDLIARKTEKENSYKLFVQTPDRTNTHVNWKIIFEG
jgi:hypothetical protein